MDSIKNTSESEQMYLVTIARLGERVDECPIPIARVAEILEVTPISANQMVHHLEQMGLVAYTPYKGVEFTELGWQSAMKILRNRRLWEVFLVERLQVAPEDIGPLVCKLEHAITEETANRLAEYLGYPEVSPLGKPIPAPAAKNGRLVDGVPLSGLPAGATGIICGFHTGDAEKRFLMQAGLNNGAQITVLAIQQGGSCLVQSRDKDPIALTAALAKKIVIKPTSIS